MLNSLTGFGFALILAMEFCLYRARRLHSAVWERRGRCLQAGVIVIYTVIVALAWPKG